MTDKIAALLHVWDSDYTEMGVYEALTLHGPEAAELRAKRDQLKACIEQLREAVAKPLPPDVKKRLEEWLTEDLAPAPLPEKPLQKVFFIGQPHQLSRFINTEKLHPSQVIHVKSHMAARGWSYKDMPDATIHVSGETPWPLAQTLLLALKERGFTRTYSPSR
ncbi:hypothetical protein SEA_BEATUSCOMEDENTI_9 [Arthrobacter phage BeatusComedenti]|uniref:Uncharacterized protein n=1 Tax=Arthrobacter phage BeatusComedenti TaxID=2656523 RepID=A0A649VW06_9CAUD|nr:hypothetical protein SEA_BEATUSCOMEDENTI_9 [Arthrobacter phage BeatusComedenti]